jgi:peroxiredoxin (alkyl hydroperoxide reductase subunit C)
MTLIGKPVPDWTAAAYTKGEEIRIGAKDYAGKWYVLYFYPLDFTFVCPTEIRGFQSLLGEFEAEGIAVIGASTDSFHSHKAWFADRSTFPEAINHPVIANTAHTVSRAFGVLNEDLGIAFRATVVVDHESIVRSVAVNDLNAGRSPPKVLRTAQALKAGELCGADWRKGDRYAA